METLQETRFATPDDKGRFDSEYDIIAAPGKLYAVVQVIEQADGWRASATATLPDADFGDDEVSMSRPPYPTRGEAIVAALEELVSFCGEQKAREKTTRKHRAATEAVQDWALELAKREMAAAVPVAGNEGYTVGEIYDAMQAGVDTEEHEAAEVIDETPVTPGSAEDAASPTPVEAASQPPAAQLIALEDLYDSEWNPRQDYPEASLAELAESMRAHGFQDWRPPLIARPRRAGGYELGAGHRRKRAAQMAGLTHVPVLVREMSDAEFLELLNLENADREDIHPLHQAQGWQVWMDQTGISATEIARSLGGRSKQFVSKRMAALRMIDLGQQMYLHGDIKESHAALLGRLTHYDQRRAILANWPAHDPDRNVTSRQLNDWIAVNCERSLHDCGFDLADETLLPLAGSCLACPKRSGSNPELFADVVDPLICMDGACFRTKQEAARDREAERQVLAQPEAAQLPDDPEFAEPEEPEVEDVPEWVGPPPLTRAEIDKAEADAETDAALRKAEKARKELAAQQRAEDERKRAEQERVERKANERAKLTYKKTVEAICAAAKFPPSLAAMRELAFAVIKTLEGGEACDIAADMYRIPQHGGTRQRDIEQGIYRLPADTLVRISIGALLLDLGAKLKWANNTSIISLADAHKVDRVKVARAVDAELSPKPVADPRKKAIGKLPAMGGAKKAAAKKATVKKSAAAGKGKRK